MTDKHSLRKDRWRARVAPGAQLVGSAATVGAVTELAGWPWALLLGGVIMVAVGVLKEAGRV